MSEDNLLSHGRGSDRLRCMRPRANRKRTLRPNDPQNSQTGVLSAGEER